MVMWTDPTVHKINVLKQRKTPDTNKHMMLWFKGSIIFHLFSELNIDILTAMKECTVCFYLAKLVLRGHMIKCLIHKVTVMINMYLHSTMTT